MTWTLAEMYVAARVAHGGVADLSQLSEKVLRAEFVRLLVLGVAVETEQHHAVANTYKEYGGCFADGAPSPIRVLLPGVRIMGASIVGCLDLSDCSGAAGAGLPPLVLEQCTFSEGVVDSTGAEISIDISHAKIARLSLKGSKFSALIGREAEVSGQLDLSAVQPRCGWTEFDGEDRSDDTGHHCWCDLTGSRIDGEIALQAARLRMPPRRKAGSFPADARRYALRLNQCEISGSIYAVRGCIFEGGVSLSAARVGGDLWFSGSRVRCAEGDALRARAAVVGRNASFDRGFKSFGVIDIAGTQIGGRLSFVSSQLNAYGRKATLRAERIAVGGSLALRKLRADRSISFAGSSVGGDVELREAELEAVSFERVSVAGELCIRENKIATSTSLENAYAAVLDDDAGGYGDRAALELDGFKYDRFHNPTLGPPGGASHEVHRERCKWLARASNYRPQPYAQLARTLEAHGFREDARKVETRKLDIERSLQRRSLAEAPFVERAPRFIAYLGNTAFGGLFGYGLRPSRAVTTLFMGFLVGWLLFAFVNWRGAMIIDQQPVAASFQEARLGAQRAEGGVVTGLSCHESFRPSLYALDVYLPLIDLRQETKCEVGAAENVVRAWGPLSDGVPLAGGWRWAAEVEVYRYLKALYAVSGWLIVSLSILTFSGAMRPRVG